eukprot:350867-Chlamydomonas_euryale.AAC.3
MGGERVAGTRSVQADAVFGQPEAAAGHEGGPPGIFHRVHPRPAGTHAGMGPAGRGTVWGVNAWVWDRVGCERVGVRPCGV